jgi:hypothetical protein
VRLGDCVAVFDGLPELVREGVREADAVGVWLGLGLELGVWLGEPVPEGVSVREAVAVGESEGVPVGEVEKVGVVLPLSLTVGEALREAVGEREGVHVAVIDCVGEREAVGEEDMERLGVGDEERVVPKATSGMFEGQAPVGGSVGSGVGAWPLALMSISQLRPSPPKLLLQPSTTT